MDLSSKFALDVQGVSRLKFTARQDQQEGLKQTARQFEAMLMQMMLKGMRDTVPESGLLGSNQTKMYQSMMDQQWAQTMSGQGIGIADMLIKQLGGKDVPAVNDASPEALHASQPLVAGIPVGTPGELKQEWIRDNRQARDTTSSGDWFKAQVLVAEQAETRVVTPARSADASSLPTHVQAFIDKVGAAAERISAVAGVSSRLIVAQAALETGWGRHEIAAADGSKSHNLFNIKATSGWQGERADVMTTEYAGKEAYRMKDGFRVYHSYEQSFQDYARLLTENSRYDGVVAAESDEAAAWQLQNSGYATDPQYARKLISIMSQLPEHLGKAVASSGSVSEPSASGRLTGASSDDRLARYTLDQTPSRIF
ncbi:flagellar assembly peptidoglycan hydrolase FlgJ [Larsenimonas rhizosphaerae]|uniref:flagellar assembly peptidoglycan hydrolase FlgJ n=1 Tax=Larsenimonas rhizosphaerae TaxID=2944682 RepID=UPI0020347EDC|nr:flagellar assembly peptidoglycan hydrolase FlgJ [Larsenimonas rhizosphaerae]MCM2130403.1 flagellar assembly peptidoglycan hydrolase FlgJ [Larsenimonas rhizosphaerae]